MFLVSGPKACVDGGRVVALVDVVLHLSSTLSKQKNAKKAAGYRHHVIESW